MAYENAKQCTKCLDWFTLGCFYKDKTKKDGLRPECKNCVNIRQKEYRKTHEIEIAERKAAAYQTITGHLRRCYANIVYRCTNLNGRNYDRYGGRGICCLFSSADEFIDYVVNVLQIDPSGLTIDRINNDGHYEPGNIRFILNLENQRNKKRKCYV